MAGLLGELVLTLCGVVAIAGAGVLGFPLLAVLCKLDLTGIGLLTEAALLGERVPLSVARGAELGS